MFAGLCYLVCTNKRLIYKWNSLVMLANRGHIHTIEMILMLYAHIFHNEEAVKLNNRCQENNFNVESAEFSFLVSRQVGNVSDVIYSDNFVPNFSKREVFLNFWIFGENNIKPENCCIERGKNENMDRINLTPRAVNNLCYEYYKDENIYAVECNLGKIETNKEIVFSYMRQQSYDWSKGGTFIIYPKCFVNKMEHITFKVEFQDNTLGKMSVEFIELYCDGSKPREVKISFKEKEMEGRYRTVYVTQPIKVNINNVYIIKTVKK